MAEGFPSHILDTVLKQLESPLFQSCNKLNFILHTQLRDIRSKLELIREVIDDAELMGVLFPEFVGYWVCELQCVLYDVDDLLDEALTRSMPASDMFEKLRLHLANVPFGLTLAHKVKKMNRRLERIVEKCYECNLFVVESSQLQSQPRKPVARKGILRYDPDYVKDDDEFQMIGRDNDKKKVIEMLRGPCSGDPFILVNGKRGVGKTTLCRAVFNDVQVKDWFQIRLWFNFHEDCEDWCKKILSELGADEEAQPHTETGIESKRILLVFDNICSACLSDHYLTNNYFQLSRKLDPILERSRAGSKVLLPLINNESFRVYARLTNNVYELNDLSEDNSRSIFEKAARVVPGDNRHMRDLGEQIVSKCMRIPALLKGVGTLLSESDNRIKWQYFAHNFDFSVRYDHYVDISLLHNPLPRCHCNVVGYLSLFFESEFKEKSLAQQFAAHGFTDISTDQMLANYGPILNLSSKDNWDGEVNLKITGDDIKYVLLQMAGRESATAQCTKDVIHEAARHVSIVRPSSPAVQQTREIMLPHGLIKDFTHRRTLLLLGELPVRMSVQTLHMLASNLQYVRVLDLHDLALQTLPSSMGNLIHLRYLDLSRNNFKMLPKSICKLKNLQTLKLFYCDKLVKLPRRMDILGQLKNLEINMCFDLTLMPPTIARLTDLEKMDRFVVNPHKGGLRYLEHLNNLNGNLDIELPRWWKASTIEADQAKLERKNKLTALRFKWPGIDNGGDTNEGEDNDVVLDKLKLGDGIECLSVVNFGGTKFPSWIVEISCLSEIVISKCKRCKLLPSFHQVPKLRLLTLTSIMNIEYLQDYNNSGDMSVFFPSLKELKIGEMPNLKGWSEDLGSLPRFPDIDSLSVWSCPRLTMMPLFSNIGGSLALQAVSVKMLQLFDWRRSRNVSLMSIPDMVVLPGEFVNKLESLTIKDCDQLQMLWTNEVQGAKAGTSMLNRLYQRLCISNAPTLKHICSNIQQLSNLGSLEISECSEELDCLYNEDGMPWKDLESLRYLKIKGFHKLVALPKGFPCLRGLQRLLIENCTALKWETGSLPPNLEELCIKSCPLFFGRNEDIKREHPRLKLVDHLSLNLLKYFLSP